MGAATSSKVDVNLDLAGNTLTFGTGATTTQETVLTNGGKGCLTPGTLIAPLPASPFVLSDPVYK